MIFSKNSRKAPHLLSLLVAFAVAVGMWYVVSVRDRLEVQLEVGIEYNGIPSGLVVTDGLVSKVQVRLRGPEILLRSISSRSLTEAINLSNIKKGTTIVPLTSDNMGPSLRAFELVDVQPPRIVITADTLAERSVPIRAVLESPLRSGSSRPSTTCLWASGWIPRPPAPRWSRPCCWIPPAWSPPTPPR